MVDGNMEIVHEGMLKKSPPPKRLWRAKWRMRWFVLRSGELPGQYFLEYYTDRTRRKLKGKIDLDQCDQVDAGITFANRKSEYKYMFDIKTPKRVYYLCAETEQEMNRWVDCVCHVCGLKIYTQEDEYPLPINHIPTTPSATPPAPLHSLPLDHQVLDSPPQSPSSPSSSTSGPYIPISTCFTGKRTPNTNSCFPFNDIPLPGSLENHRSSIPNEIAPPAPVMYHDSQPPLTQAPPAPTVNTGAIPRESYDSHRQLRPSGASEDALSVQSPLGTECSSVFSGDDWDGTPLKVEAKFFSDGTRPRDTFCKDGQWDGLGSKSGLSPGLGNVATLPNDIRSLSISDDDHQQVQAAPPRPPKPPHLAEIPQQIYQNLDTITRTSLVRKNSSNEKIRNGIGGTFSVHEANTGTSDPEPSPASGTCSIPPSTPRDINEDVHVLVRSQQYSESVSPQAAERTIQRHCCNNFVQTPSQSQIFSYDVRVHDIHDKQGELDPRISPASLYSNIPQTNKSPIYPPAVDRGLKPKKTSDGGNMSCSELSPPPSGGPQEVLGAVGGSPAPPSSAPPVVDRNLKPTKNPSESVPKNMFVLDPAPIRLKKHDQRKRGAPSPTPPTLRNGRSGNESGDEADHTSNSGSRRNSTNADEQNACRPQHEIQYLDLDLDPEAGHSPKSLKGASSKCSVGASAPSVVYKKVDFVKTDAFNKMRINVEDTYRKNQ
ncbi:protein daughter of sevenless isoform X2 [Procambarus clarkii]|uniref:protein daughter of sevenless isoform X2 n=1 Tax=Procambarus clarkii TaxID=6728 RepID=UPI001E672E2E|nr:GRB2-associated-binding protein 1-like isoform X2 [Procambarus clarkii]